LPLRLPQSPADAWSFTKTSGGHLCTDYPEIARRKKDIKVNFEGQIRCPDSSKKFFQT